MKLKWIIIKNNRGKFPFRLFILNEKEVLLSLLIQELWPGEKGNIFCLEADNKFPKEAEVIEEVSVKSFRKYNVKLIITLDRNIKNKCEFLFIKKKYKHKEGYYNQIFFRTQKGIRERKPRLYLPKANIREHTILISSNERYAYSFGDAKIIKGYLKTGDYALLSNTGEIKAVVERKTFQNFIKDISNINLFLLNIEALASYKNSALLIEANYYDFLNPEKVKPLKATTCSRLISELFVKSQVQIVFAGSRKAAQEWIKNYFSTIIAHNNTSSHPSIKEIPLKYYCNKENGYEKILTLLNDEPMTTREISEKIQVPINRVRHQLKMLHKSGFVKMEKSGRDLVWTYIPKFNTIFKSP